MNEDKFWSIIGQSLEESDGSQDEQEASLEKLLTALSVDDLIAFDRIFTEMRFKAYTWDLWGAAYIINGGCSNDGFDYFRSALIGAGRDKFEAALDDPKSMADWVEPDFEFETLMYVPDKVYRQKTGTNDSIKHENLPYPEITGEEWSEDSDDLEKRFPVLWNRFMSEGA